MDLKVFITIRESVCDECGAGLGHHAWITLVDGKAYRLSCANLDHLIFPPAGDAALTRRAGKYSTLSAVVLKWSRARRRERVWSFIYPARFIGGRETIRLSFFISEINSSKGRGGGPLTTFPTMSK